MTKADLEFMQAEWRMDPDKSTLERLGWPYYETKRRM